MSARGKLLFVVNNPAFFLSHRLPIAQAAREEGWEVHVATPERDGADAVRRHGFVFHTVPMDRSKGRPWRELGTVLALHRLYRRLRPDLVHHVTIKPVLYGTVAARWAGVPAVVNAISGMGYVFLSRGMKGALVRALVHAAYRFSLRHPRLRVIFQNPDDRAYFASRKLVREVDAVLIKGSGADTDAFRPAPEPAGDPTVVLAGRMLWDKGVGEYVRAAALLRPRHLRARFVLVGDPDPGNPASIPRHWLEEAQRSGHVEWWGHRDDMAAVLGGAHVVCLPSYREGLPKVLIEAAACGRPIVATDAPGCREIVRHGENGLLVPLRDDAGLAQAIDRLLSEPELRSRLGRRGREMVEEEFSLEHVVGRSLELYRELFGAAPRPIKEAA